MSVPYWQDPGWWIPLGIGAVVSGLASYMVSKKFYQRSGDDLKREAGELKVKSDELMRFSGKLMEDSREIMQLNQLIYHVVHDLKLAEVSFDPSTGVPTDVKWSTATAAYVEKLPFSLPTKRFSVVQSSQHKDE